jgi:cation diffusion facilitator CzcD-associated flavoprotein CzcO
MSRRRQANPHTVSAPAGEVVTHDIVIVGVGPAGINTAYPLQTEMPHLSLKLLEARSSIGGTWDLFRYPGVRSDSDMYTYGFAWHPWRHKLLGNGDKIMSYLHECVSAYGLEKLLKPKHKVVKADWSSQT